MGKSPESKRLTIMVEPEWYDRPEIVKLREQGHTILVLIHSVGVPNLILSPAAWNWDDKQWPYLPVAIKAARARKEGKEPDE